MIEILFAGAGGQGVLTAGDIVAEVAISKGLETTWAPEYGSAMRGGDANCTVKFGENKIYNPTRSNPDILLAMNESSFDKFIETVEPGGTVVVNSDMIDSSKNKRDDIKIIDIPCMTLASEINHPMGANIIMTAVIIKESETFTEKEGLAGMNEMFNRTGKGRFEEANTKAFKLGYSL